MSESALKQKCKDDLEFIGAEMTHFGRYSKWIGGRFVGFIYRGRAGGIFVNRAGRPTDMPNICFHAYHRMTIGAAIIQARKKGKLSWQIGGRYHKSMLRQYYERL